MTTLIGVTDNIDVGKLYHEIAHSIRTEHSMDVMRIRRKMIWLVIFNYTDENIQSVYFDLLCELCLRYAEGQYGEGELF